MTVCPKCQYTSGDDWSQCEGQCPMRMSPYYTEEVEAPGRMNVRSYDDYFVDETEASA